MLIDLKKQYHWNVSETFKGENASHFWFDFVLFDLFLNKLSINNNNKDCRMKFYCQKTIDRPKSSCSWLTHPYEIIKSFQVLSWRVLSSVVRGLILQVSTLFAFNCILSFAPLTPIQWISSNFGVFLTPSSWLYDILVIACFSGLALLQAKELHMVTYFVSITFI